MAGFRDRVLSGRTEHPDKRVPGPLKGSLVRWLKGAFEWVCNLLGIITSRARVEGLISSYAHLKVAAGFMRVTGAELRTQYAEADPGLIKLIAGIEGLGRSSTEPDIRRRACRLSGDGFARKLKRDWLDPKETRSFLASYQEVWSGLPDVECWNRVSVEVRALARASDALYRASRISDYAVIDAENGWAHGRV